MDTKIIKYIIKELIHTHTDSLFSASFNDAKREFPNLDDNTIRGYIDVNLLTKSVVKAMKARAAHEGVSLDELLA